MKIDTMQMKKNKDGTFAGEVTPTRFQFASDKLVYPLKITQISREGQDRGPLLRPGAAQGRSARRLDVSVHVGADVVSGHQLRDSRKTDQGGDGLAEARLLSSALISSNGTGKIVCIRRCETWPIASSFVHPYSFSAPRFQKVMTSLLSRTKTVSCVRSRRFALSRKDLFAPFALRDFGLQPFGNPPQVGGSLLDSSF